MTMKDLKIGDIVTIVASTRRGYLAEGLYQNRTGEIVAIYLSYIMVRLHGDNQEVMFVAEEIALFPDIKSFKVVHFVRELEVPESIPRYPTEERAYEAGQYVAWQYKAITRWHVVASTDDITETQNVEQENDSSRDRS